MQSVAPVAVLVLLTLAGCAQPGSMMVGGPSTSGGGGYAHYSKYFDAGVWLIEHKLGMSVVVDNDTPISNQVLGGLRGTDSDGIGTATIYFWNLEPKMRVTNLIRFQHEQTILEHKSPFTIGPGPFARTGHKAGKFPFFAYATELKTKVWVEIDGVEVVCEVTAQRRTFAEIDKYFGAKGRPPYPWYDDRYSIQNLQPAAK
jgi:hypothetical protein